MDKISNLEGEKERLKKEKGDLGKTIKEIEEGRKLEEMRVKELDDKVILLQQENEKNKSTIRGLEGKNCLLAISLLIF